MTEAEILPAWIAGVSVAGSEPRQATDYELAQRAAQGDMHAFEQLYERHHRHVYGLCLRMTQNVAEAEDLTQDVFIHLYRKVGSFRGEASFMTWLHRLTVNHVLMHFRRSRARKDQTPLDDVPPAALGRGVQHGGSANLLDRVTLDRAIAQLPTGYRTVFLLHDAMGFEHTEIARLLGCAEGTSKSQLHKARMKLRRIIKGRMVAAVRAVAS